MKLFLLASLLFTLISCEKSLEIKKISLNSCADYLKDNPSLPNGFYSIDHDVDESTPKITVYCDMSGGGWTRIIKDSTTTTADLAVFGDVSEIESTFYSDPTMGIGWGEAIVTGGSNADCRYAPKFVMAKLWNYTQMKITVSARASIVSAPDNSVGYMYINNEFDNEARFITSFVDAWLADASGANSITNNNGATPIRARDTIDVLNYDYIVAASGNKMQVCMGGEDSYVYNERFIGELWIR